MWLHFALIIIRKSGITSETLVKPRLPDCVKTVLLAHGSFWVGPQSEPCQPMLEPKIIVWQNDAIFSNKLVCQTCMTRIFSSKKCLLVLASNDREMKYLLTQGVWTGKQVRRQVRDWTNIPLINRTFKLYPCGCSVNQGKKLFFSWLSVVMRRG